MNATQQKPLKINIGAVKRLQKEYAMCEKEWQDACAKVTESKDEPGSPELKHLSNLRQEAEAAFHDVEKRLADFKKKLETALKDVPAEFGEDPLVVEARALV
jgi:chromosome segregation ATPase